ncbi:hypothetical protein EYF80_048396 [Liparis tanakae]|uniref:Uncharacterized protein n=1 Tax=Liparis tanakae TaxID=230148 RepID=A0A4Z2FKZ0_9TELE|nr:hypothetical protein EYF80_048396 [Liparis tanakae]
MRSEDPGPDVTRGCGDITEVFSTIHLPRASWVASWLLCTLHFLFPMGGAPKAICARHFLPPGAEDLTTGAEDLTFWSIRISSSQKNPTSEYERRVDRDEDSVCGLLMEDRYDSIVAKLSSHR